MATLKVGAGQQYATISAAVNASKDGDIVEVQAGTYVNDFATINTKITLQAVGGMVSMVATGSLPNDKGILVVNTDVTIDHFEFSGAEGASGNGAGIRYQSGALTITNSYFHDNQNGLLANPSATGTITIRNSEFANNGSGDGYTHNLYVGAIAKLTVENSYFHDANVGHEIKSRAAETVITNSRIIDYASTSSYSVDLPNGGKATLIGNVIQQGPNGDNPNIIAFGAEGLAHSVNSLTMTGNTVINDMGKGALVFNASGSPVTLDGTSVWGISDSQMGSAVKVTNTVHLSSSPALDASHPWASSGAPAPTTPTPTPTPGGLSVTGGDGGELHWGGSGADFIRGMGGDDTIHGAEGADTVNGNLGQDSVTGGGGADIVYGGQGNDYVDGGAGDDLHVNGNMGADTVHGGDGADTVYGGQGNDLVYGDAGNDRLSGDLGDDILFGGAGADRFVVNAGFGHDWVADFNPLEGDRILLAKGAAYTLGSENGQVLIQLSDGSTLGLAGVSSASFSADWVVYG